MQNVICANNFQELSINDLMCIDGGEWSWKAFAQSAIGGGTGGAIAGACGGAITLPVIGSVPGAVGGGILGVLGGAAAYAVCGWW
jgi:hypothetical protein